MILAPPQEVNHDELFNVIEESRKLINPIKGKKGQHVVIVQGFSGAGKSSMVLTLSGESMIGYHHAESKVPILMSKNKEGKNGIKIEKEILAGTIRPACAQMDRSKFKEEVILCDMPGIGENRGLTQSLINSYYYMSIFQVQPLIKIALVMTHNDINLGSKGINLSNVFGDFIKMFGDVELYEKSLFVVITKAPRLFEKEDALNSFEKINALPAIRDNSKVNKLVSKIANNTIPIIVFNEPDLGLDFISQENQLLVNSSYNQFIEDFYRIVMSLQPSRELKLQSAAMSSEETDKCLKFADSIRDELNQATSQLLKKLAEFIKISCPDIGQHSSLLQIQEAIQYVGFMRQFIETFQVQIEVGRQKEKATLKKKFDDINQLFVRYKITALNPQEEICLLMDSIEHYFILINFLNHQNFNKRQGYDWIDQIHLMQMFFSSLKQLRIDLIWRQVEETFKQKIKNIVVDNFARYVQGMKHSDIYVDWANSFRSYPSYALRLTKYLQIHRHQGSNPVREYFRDVYEVEKEFGSNAAELDTINEIIHFSQRIGIRLEQGLVSEIFIPMMQSQQNKLIERAVRYDTWSQEFNTKILSWLKKKTANIKIRSKDQYFRADDLPNVDRQIPDTQLSIAANNEKILAALQTKEFLESEINRLEREKEERTVELENVNYTMKMQRQSAQKLILKLRQSKVREQNQQSQMKKLLQKKKSQGCICLIIILVLIGSIIGCIGFLTMQKQWITKSFQQLQEKYEANRNQLSQKNTNVKLLTEMIQDYKEKLNKQKNEGQEKKKMIQQLQLNLTNQTIKLQEEETKTKSLSENLQFFKRQYEKCSQMNQYEKYSTSILHVSLSQKQQLIVSLQASERSAQKELSKMKANLQNITQELAKAKQQTNRLLLESDESARVNANCQLNLHVKAQEYEAALSKCNTDRLAQQENFKILATSKTATNGSQTLFSHSVKFAILLVMICICM